MHLNVLDGSVMDARAFYLNEVYPQLELPLAEKYPLVSLTQHDRYHALANHPLLMLVALTGTGKSTTLDILQQRTGGAGMRVIPSRREVADWIALPFAQVLLRQPIAPVSDRVKRFRYTRLFAEHVPGGMAAAFSWLNLTDDYRGLVLSEGIRGPNEIRYVLNQFSCWQIVELALHPLTRLRRLSGRQQDFDQAGGGADLSFLPLDLQGEAQSLFEAGEITGKALAIVRAEAANYGLYPFEQGTSHSNYHQVAVDGCSPGEVARAVINVIKSSDIKSEN